VQPEDEDIFGIAQASGLPTANSSGQGFVPGKKVKTWKASPQIFPTQLSRELNKS
jgi:preprotein translocase subunit SecA